MSLNSGARMPLVGLGTWEADRGQVAVAVEAALAAGVRHFDCAASYRNEGEVGEALHAAVASGTVTRGELFVTSKLWNGDHRRVREACLRSLRALRLDRLDLYLVHWPVASGQARGADLRDTWRGMEALVAEGLVTSIGVANLSAAKLTALLAGAPHIVPAVNQVAALSRPNRTDPSTGKTSRI